MMTFTKLLFAVLIVVQCAFVFLRTTWSGVSYYRLVRIHNIVNSEFLMLFGSTFIWKRIVAALSSFDPKTVTPVRFRWRTICVQDIAKAILLLFLLLSQVSFVFYFVYLGSEPNMLAICSLTALATYLHVFVFLLVAEGVHHGTGLAAKCGILKTGSQYIHDSRHSYSLLATFCALLFIMGGLYSTFREPVYTTARVPMRHFKSGSSDVSVALLSDIHIGPTVGRKRMETIAKLTNALNPDIIAISGDLADGFVRDLRDAAQPLCSLTAKHGIYFATGNHEYMHGNVEEWFEFLNSCNITVLHNDNKRIRIEENDYCIAGTDDLFAAKAHFPGHAMNPQKALSGCVQGDSVIVLAHQPNAASIILKEQKEQNNVDLILSGHTHGGQMYMLMPIVYIMNAFTRGLYEHVSGSYVYVSAGVNFFGPPIKMFGACEIINITLSSA